MQDAPTLADDSLERRIVTVLFADLVGFTALSERFDAEDVAAIQDSYFGSVRDTIGRYGGQLEKFIGDAAMAVFGVPRSRDDDVERAVRAGLALTYAIQQLGAQFGLEDDALRLRVGINTGEVVVAAGGLDEWRVTGDTVNTAARLQTAAPPGGVLIGEASALAVADVAEMEPVPPLELKGKAEPTAARVVIGMRPEPSREQAMGDLRAPMLGRDRELRTLDAALGRASDGGVERLLIVAPPGVGKSRLLREMADRLTGPGTAGDEQSNAVWRSRARPDSLSPFDPISRLMRDALSAAGADRGAAETRLRERLAAAGTPDLRARVVVDSCLAAAWPPSTTQDGRPTDERAALFDAWLEGLDVLGGDQTQVWLIEDVHWAGGDVLAFLDAAATVQGERRRGRLLIATARPSLLDAQPAWSAHEPSAGRTVMHLSTLEATDAASLVRALVGDALPDDLVERIAERSDGNCLFIEELLRTWISVGTLVPNPGSGQTGWRLTLPAGDIPLPQSVQSIYAAQLDDLPPAARRLARRASVAGRRFPVAALEPLGADATDGLHPLRRRALVVGPVDEPVVGEAFSYRHALLRDAGYASLARAERARLHVRLARWLETAAGDRGDEVAEQIATHYATALESAPALAREIDEGMDRDQVRRLAAQWYERAGRATLAVSAHDAARQLIRHSIDLTPQDALLEQAVRWEKLGDATAFAADMDEGAAAYERSTELYRRAIAEIGAGFDQGSVALGRASDVLARQAKAMASWSPEGAAELLQGASELRAGTGELNAARAELETELGVARTGLARSASSLADVMYQQLRFDESRQLADSVLTELGDADPSSTSRLLTARTMGMLGSGGWTPEAQAVAERAVELAAESGDPEVELRALRALTSAVDESGHSTHEAWQRVESAATEQSNWPVAIGAMVRSALWWIDDNAPLAYENAARARNAALAHGRTEDAGWADYAEAEAAFASGDWDRAYECGLRAVDLGERNGYRRLTVRNLHVLIPMAAVRSDRGVLERAARWYGGLGDTFHVDSPYGLIMRAAQDIELSAAGLFPPYLPDVESRASAFAEEPSGPSYCAALDRLLRAWLEGGLVDAAAVAVDGLAQAITTFEDVTPLSRGTFALLRGRMAEARSDFQATSEAGRSALALFRANSNLWWVAKAVRLIERAGDADDDLVAEAAAIELRLGAVAPTA